MSEDCLFCQIVDGAIPSHTVYEDESAYAFLDVNPLARGHTLVIPRTHHEQLTGMPAETLGALGEAVGAVVPAVEAAVEAPASTVAVNNGPEAGQEVPHVHWHIVPRYSDDDVGPIHALFDGVDLPDDEMASIADRIRSG